MSLLLRSVSEGDPQARGWLIDRVYDELRGLARALLVRHGPGHTWQPTALVHEAYLRLFAKSPDRPWETPAHFFADAAEAMRHLLVEGARRRTTLKRGGRRVRVSLDVIECLIPQVPDELLALDEALDRLADIDFRAAGLVKLRYFGGLTLIEAAVSLGITPRMAKSIWAYARAWLLTDLQGDA